MLNILLCCSLIVMSSILSSTHALLNIDSNISNVLPQQLHVTFHNSSIWGKGNDQSAYLKTEFFDNAIHSIVKRKANNLLRTSMKNKSPRPDERSLVLVFDATESMSNALQQLRQGAEKMFNKLSELKDNPIYSYIFVPFREENGAIG